MKKVVQTKAHINIALVKYWGKMDHYYNLANQPSLSYTINEYYTICNASISDKDILLIDSKQVDNIEQTKISNWLDKIRKMYNINSYIKFDNYNYVPFKAGLASSASAYAAMSLAINELFNLNLSKQEISIMARMGSGSALRSVYGGFVSWEYSDKNNLQYAKKLPIDWEDFKMFACVIENKSKKISSRDAMNQSVKIKQYKNFVKQSFIDYNLMQQYLLEKDIWQVGLLAEKNANQLHEIINLTNINYFTKETEEIIKLVQKIRKLKNIPIFYTIDAGPNVKLISLKEHEKLILEAFKKYNIISLTQGGDAHVID